MAAYVCNPSMGELETDSPWSLLASQSAPLTSPRSVRAPSQRTRWTASANDTWDCPLHPGTHMYTHFHTHACTWTHTSAVCTPPPDTEAGGIWSKYMIRIFENAIMKAAILCNQGVLIYFSDIVWVWHCGPTSADCRNRCQEVSCWKTTKRKAYVLHGFSIASNC